MQINTTKIYYSNHSNIKTSALNFKSNPAHEAMLRKLAEQKQMLMQRENSQSALLKQIEAEKARLLAELKQCKKTQEIKPINYAPTDTGIFSNEFQEQMSRQAQKEEEEKHKEILKTKEQEIKQRFKELDEKRIQEVKRQQNTKPFEIQESYNINDTDCSESALFTLNFACAIDSGSEHKMEEFFAPEEIAAKLRENLSCECQLNSVELRDAIQNMKVFKDPVLGLISANKMKDFIPDKSIMDNNIYKNTILQAKKCYTDSIDNADLTTFAEYEKSLIKELNNIIKTSKSLVFGDEFAQKLQLLLNSIHSQSNERMRTMLRQRLVSPKI